MPKTARDVAGMASADRVNVAGLENQLRRHVSGEVRFDTATKAMYANDASNFRQVPIGVVVPKTLDDVVQTVRACHAYHAPVLCRGGGTSLSGETVNVAVVMDFSKYLTDIIDIDGERRLATVQTGVINEQLNKATGKQRVGVRPRPVVALAVHAGRQPWKQFLWGALDPSPFVWAGAPDL